MDEFTRLRARFPGLSWEENFSFARHTTIGCGGWAALAVTVPDGESAAALLGQMDLRRIPYCFLGAGANVLPGDGLYEGVVVRVGDRALRADGETVRAGGGATGGALLRFAAAAGVGGFEPFTGIPMTVGGGVAMNAGIAERHFGDVVVRVRGVEGGKVREFSRRECRFREKDSLFLEGVLVTEAILCGKAAGQGEIAARTEAYRARRASLPKGRSMGCVFVNPPGQSAGRLIEGCGLKGARIGGAAVSGRHANFILNEGATSAEIAALVSLVKERVRERTGILLKEEIRPIGTILPLFSQ